MAQPASVPAMALPGAILEGASTTAVQTLTVSDSAKVHVGNRYNIHLAADGTTGMTVSTGSFPSHVLKCLIMSIALTKCRVSLCQDASPAHRISSQRGCH